MIIFNSIRTEINAPGFAHKKIELESSEDKVFFNFNGEKIEMKNGRDRSKGSKLLPGVLNGLSGGFGTGNSSNNAEGAKTASSNDKGNDSRNNDASKINQAEGAGKHVHHIDLLLPVGKHAYTVDYTSAENQNSDSQTIVATVDDARASDAELVLETNWLRSNDSGSYELITGAHSLNTLPQGADIDKFMQLNIKLMKNGSELWNIFDITKNIKASEPTVSQIRLVGSLVECETLNVYYNYSGGLEGKTQIRYVYVLFKY